jgi:aquaporin Z
MTEHWPEYLIESAALGIFMFSACFFVSLIEYPGSSVLLALTDPFLRRALVGLGMGLTAIAIIYSSWGKRSGAHLNPALTLTFYLLGKVAPWDAVFYMLSQFTGGIAGVLIARLLLGDAIVGAPSVNYVLTQPGVYGTAAAFTAEAAIAFGLMTVVLASSNDHRLNRYTGLFAGFLVAAYITLDAPLSGMNMNPARSLGSAVSAQNWTALWVYFTAPLFGMLLAAEVYRRVRGDKSILCCKLHHDNNQRCIFRCRYHKQDYREASVISGGNRPNASGSGHAPWIDTVVGVVCDSFRITERSIAPVVDLLIRVRLAQIFFVSGVLKASNWDTALYLATSEYPVAWMDPVTAAYVGVTIELLGGVLLAIGLATRLAALAMLLLSMVIQFNYVKLDANLFWVATFGWYVVRGAGPISFDYSLRRRLAGSALPLATTTIRCVEWVSRYLGPVYVLFLRAWIAAALLLA